MLGQDSLPAGHTCRVTGEDCYFGPSPPPEAWHPWPTPRFWALGSALPTSPLLLRVGRGEGDRIRASQRIIPVTLTGGGTRCAGQGVGAAGGGQILDPARVEGIRSAGQGRPQRPGLEGGAERRPSDPALWHLGGVAAHPPLLPRSLGAPKTLSWAISRARRPQYIRGSPAGSGPRRNPQGLQVPRLGGRVSSPSPAREGAQPRELRGSGPAQDPEGGRPSTVMEGGDTEQRGRLRASSPALTAPTAVISGSPPQPAHRKTWSPAFLPTSSGLIRQ